MKRWMFGAFLGAIAVAASCAWAAEPTTFQDAKRLVRGVWSDHRTEFYCGCRFDERMNVIGDCGMAAVLTKAGKPNERAERIEWEHVVPAADFGRQRSCWRDESGRQQGESAREYCERVDSIFARMHADPRNLVPAIGLLNQYRSDLRYGEIQGEAREYGSCDFERSPADSGERLIEPPANVKGDLARVYFYYETRYGHRISRQQRQLFEAWSRMDPPDAWEFERDQLLQRLTGVENPVMVAYRRNGVVPVSARPPESRLPSSRAIRLTGQSEGQAGGRP